MPNIRAMGCCGWKEITNLYTFSDRYDINFIETLRRLKRSIDRGGAFVFTAADYYGEFTQSNYTNYAKLFADNIKINRLGKVIKLPMFQNPNTKNYIQSYVWIINRERLNNYLYKSKVKKTIKKPTAAELLDIKGL